MQEIMETSRSGNRLPSYFRKVVFDIGMLDSSSGSSYLEIGNTKIICSVHGPRAIPSRGSIFSDRGQFECDFRYAPFASDTFTNDLKPGGISSSEREMSRLIEDALESTICLDKYPKSLISVHIIVLQDCGCVLASAITCTSLALMDAAVEQFELVTAAQVANVDNMLLLDPTKEELARSSGSLTVCCTSTGDITQLHVTGRLDPDSFAEMRSLAFSGCKFLRSSISASVREKIQTRLLTSAST